MLSLKSLFYSLILLTIPHFWIVAEDIKPDQTIKVPMSDGVELVTDIYLPHPEAKNLPCILLRGPAGRHTQSATMFASLAKEGYVVAIQDTRAAHDQEGKMLPFYSDGWGKQQDGYEAVEWLAKSPLTNGKIGTLGLSNMGITQILMAPTAPPSLKCQYIGVAAASLYHHAIFPGGQLLKNQVEGWLKLVGKDATVLKFVVDQPDYNDFWDGLNAMKVARQVNAPAVHQGGWYDTFIQGTIDAFTSRQNEGGPQAKGKQKLLIGPWTHRGSTFTQLGDFEIPKEGINPPLDLGPKRWFDHHLKGIPNRVDKDPAVVYYVMGPFDGSPSSGNRWRTADHWPVPHADIPFYLTSEHSLSDKTAEKETVVTYKHNIHDPVPTIGGRNLFLESGPKDQRSIEERKDVVVFTTAPLEEDLEVTGQILAKLVFSSDEEDTDVAVRLTDVYPDGRSILIADALARAGKVKQTGDLSTKEIDVDLWSTSLVFAKGHKIRISITGSNFPRFEKNGSNNGKEWITHRLHLGGKNPSRLILPVVRKGEKWLTESQGTVHESGHLSCGHGQPVGG